MKKGFIITSDRIKYILLVLMLTPGIWLMAQGQGGERIKDRVKAQRAAFITQQLNLSETEAQNFWPIYNSYQAEMQQVRSAMDIKPKADLTDKEAEDMMNSILDARTKEVEVQRKYIQKFKSAIPPRKIAMLFRSEKEFKEKVISNIKERRRERMPQRGGQE